MSVACDNETGFYRTCLFLLTLGCKRDVLTQRKQYPDKIDKYLPHPLAVLAGAMWQSSSQDKNAFVSSSDKLLVECVNRNSWQARIHSLLIAFQRFP